MDSSEHELIAHEAFSVLEVDASASTLLRYMYPDESTVLDALSYFAVDFAPGLLETFQSSEPPSVKQLLDCSLSNDTRSHWFVYLQFLAKNGEVVPHVYCGSATGAVGGHKRLRDYDAYFADNNCARHISSNVMSLVNLGYTRVGVSLIAAAKIPADALDFAYLRACMLLLEGTFAAKLWFFKAATHGTITGCRLWEKDSLPYAGLCGHSSLYEVVPPLVADVFANPDMRRDWEAARSERMKAWWAKWSHTDAGQKSLEKYRRSDKSKARLKRFRESDKGKEKAKRDRASEAFKKSVKKYAAGPKAQACREKYRATEKGQEHTKKWNDIKAAKYNKGGTAPDLFCEGCPKRYTTKKKEHMKRHKKVCPAHQE